MFSTLEFQLWHVLITGGALFFSVCALLYAVYTDRRLRTEFPTTSLLNSIRAEFSGLTGDFADLQDRFTRFQKREGMRNAREDKQNERNVLDHAREIAAQATTQDDSDIAALYRRRGKLQ